MSAGDGYKVLADLEERVKKLELVRDKATQLTQALETQLREMNERILQLQKDADFGGRFRELLAEYGHIGSAPLISSEASGTIEVHDAVQPVKVLDPKEPLVAETTSLLGQVALAILEEQLAPGKRYRVAEIADVLLRDYEGKWGKGEVQQTLEKLVAPPYRLFSHEIDAQKRHWFLVRDIARQRVQK